jgi:hypothetical protein
MTPFTATEAWAFRYLIGGNSLNGQLPLIAEPWRPLAALLDSLAAPERLHAWQSALALRADDAEVRQAVLAADLNAPMPVASTVKRFATGEDVRRTISATRWLYPGWALANSVFGVAALEGTGKTRFLLDLQRRIDRGLNWPDGRLMTLPAGSPFLWICADGHQAEIVDTAEQMGIDLRNYLKTLILLAVTTCLPRIWTRGRKRRPNFYLTNDLGLFGWGFEIVSKLTDLPGSLGRLVCEYES